jgi:carbon monoxide dehydrogenase subunit G
MKINNEFTVHAPIERAWALLTDVEAIAPCMPGAQLTGIRPADPAETPAAEVYEGKVKVKMGPVVAEYKGTASFVEKDDAAYRGVIDAKGRDSRGAGNASALITVQLRPEADGTTVAIDTELKISGKIAQFGAGMIQEVSEKLLGQFVGCLEGKLADPAESTAADPTATAAEPPATAASTATAEPAGTAGPLGTPPGPSSAVPAEPSTIAPATAPPAPPATPVAAPARRTFQTSAEPEALDLLELAGGSAVKRLLPVLIAGLAAVAAVIIFRTRR